MSEIETLWLKGVKQTEKRFKDKSKIEEFENSQTLFNSLLKIGVVEKRGNNLLSISDSYIKANVIYNTK